MKVVEKRVFAIGSAIDARGRFPTPPDNDARVISVPTSNDAKLVIGAPILADQARSAKILIWAQCQ